LAGRWQRLAWARLVLAWRLAWAPVLLVPDWLPTTVADRSTVSGFADMPRIALGLILRHIHHAQSGNGRHDE